MSELRTAADVTERRVWPSLVLGLVGPAWGWIWLFRRHAGPASIVLALVLTVVAALANRPRRRTNARVEVKGGALFLDGARVAGPESIRDAHLTRGADATTTSRVVVRRRAGSTFELDAATPEAARALLEALGFGVTQRTTTFRAALSRRTQVVTIAGLVALAAVGTRLIGSAWGMWAVFVPMMLTSIVLRLRGMSVVVGADGFVVRGLLGPRFVPYADVVSVAAMGDDGKQRRFAVVTRRSGPPIEISFERRGKSARKARRRGRAAIEPEDDRDALVARLREGLAAYERGEAGGAAANVRLALARGTRDARTWARELRALVAAETKAGYRVAALPHDALWEVLEDPAAAPGARAAAAVALAPSLDEDGKRRVRVAADATASPRVRVAITRAAEDADEEEVARALEALEDEDEEQRARGVG